MKGPRMAQAQWRRLGDVSAFVACGIVALSTNVAVASQHVSGSGPTGEPVEAAMAFMVCGAVAAGLIAGLISRSERGR